MIVHSNMAVLESHHTREQKLNWMIDYWWIIDHKSPLSIYIPLLLFFVHYASGFALSLFCIELPTYLKKKQKNFNIVSSG